MSKKTNNVLLAIAAVVVIIFGVFLFFPKAKAPTTGVILFYGDTCPHCIQVEEYIKNNNVEQKVQFEKKEVYNNQTNAATMATYYQKCGLDTAAGMGVPFLWDGQKCYSGETEIINFFASKM